MRHEVKIGDELMVEGHSLFIVTELKSEIYKPSVLTTKQPIELLEADK